MKYIADDNGYLKEVSFGSNISCDGKDCTEYTDSVPSGYNSLEDWYLKESDNLYKWYISSGNLTKDNNAQPDSNLINVDSVVDHGVSGKWTWRKWASGIAECWGVFSSAGAVQTPTAWGSIYYGGWMDTEENKNGRKYPVAFTEEPVVSATPIGVSGDFWLMTNASNNVGTFKTHAPAYSIARPDQWGATNPRISYYVVGRWK